jgi:shikimate kinase
VEKDPVKNIVLIGMPGAGKSTVGVLLAKVMGREFVDTDLLIQSGEKATLSELIERHGLAGFCDIECRYVEAVDVRNAVIATGGSVVYYESAMRHLKENGIAVYLELPLEGLKKRLTDIVGRGVVIEPGETLESLFIKRWQLYEQYADITIYTEGLTHEQVVGQIVNQLEHFQQMG